MEMFQNHAWFEGAFSKPPSQDITQSQALQSILTSQPEAIFLNPGAICSVCLAPWMIRGIWWSLKIGVI